MPATNSNVRFILSFRKIYVLLNANIQTIQQQKPSLWLIVAFAKLAKIMKSFTSLKKGTIAQIANWQHITD